ncbi:MAG: YraN family protein [Cellulosilyticaceae bacterium]
MSYMLKQGTLNHRAIGTYYEQLASAYLIQKGYEVIIANYRSRFGEIDLIAKDGMYVVFLEVKYKGVANHGYPRESVTVTKQRRIKRTAQYYLMMHTRREIYCRFDVIEILGEQITHIENAFI